MDIKTSKIELARLILDIEDPELVQKIRALVMNEVGDFWEDLTDNQKSEIELGIKQLEEGKRTSFEDFFNRVS